VKKGFAAALAIARKDLRTELRTRESLYASVSFALGILVLFSFAFDLDREEKLAISGGLLWLVYVFAGSLIVNRSFARKLPNDCASGEGGTDFAAHIRFVLQHPLGGFVFLSSACDRVSHVGDYGGWDRAQRRDG